MRVSQLRGLKSPREILQKIDFGRHLEATTGLASSLSGDTSLISDSTVVIPSYKPVGFKISTSSDGQNPEDPRDYIKLPGINKEKIELAKQICDAIKEDYRIIAELYSEYRGLNARTIEAHANDLLSQAGNPSNNNLSTDEKNKTKLLARYLLILAALKNDKHKLTVFRKTTSPLEKFLY